MARTGGVIIHPITWFWSRSWGRFAIKTLNTGETLKWIDSRLFILLIIGDLLSIFNTLIVAEKYEKCVQFGYNLVKDTSDVERFLAFLIKVFHPLDKPGQYCFLWRKSELELKNNLFTWSCLERNCIKRKTNKCMVSLSASSKSTILWVYPGNALVSSTMFNEWTWPSVTLSW